MAEGLVDVDMNLVAAADTDAPEAVKQAETTQLLLGPVIGRVTDTTARVLIETAVNAHEEKQFYSACISVWLTHLLSILSRRRMVTSSAC